jgi:hypothetical protein
MKLAHKNCCNGSKSGCWCCGMQICQDAGCKFNMEVYVTDTERHLETCVPYCSPCFKKGVCSIPLGKSHSCSCGFNPRGSGFFRRDFCLTCAPQPRAHASGIVSMLAAEAMSPSTLRWKLRDKRIRREKVLLWEKGTVTELECFRCKEKITGPGPLWWFCTSCRRECQSELHPAWATKEMIRDRGQSDAGDMV